MKFVVPPLGGMTPEGGITPPEGGTANCLLVYSFPEIALTAGRECAETAEKFREIKLCARANCSIGRNEDHGRE
ncbi:hypothetical protein QUF80_09310 [Desulfococcaceae bacterium HSG8]|nr:hypothetical protein [Desulfococcaceae bacterium HSG8]